MKIELQTLLDVPFSTQEYRELAVTLKGRKPPCAKCPNSKLRACLDGKLNEGCEKFVKFTKVKIDMRRIRKWASAERLK